MSRNTKPPRVDARPGCPRPDKRPLADQGEAIAAALHASEKWGRALAPYRCTCKAWHLTGWREDRPEHRAIAEEKRRNAQL